MPRPKSYGGKSVKQHAAELGEPVETVRGWLEKHSMPPDEPARSQWVDAWRSRRLNRPKGEHEDDDPDSLKSQKLAAELQGRKLRNASLAMDLEVKRGKLIPVDEAKRLQAQLAAVIKQAFLELPTAVADLIDPEDPERVRDILRREVHSRLDRLSRDEPPK